MAIHSSARHEHHGAVGGPETFRTVCKRLGFMLEILKRDAPTVVTFCASRVSAGNSH